MPEIDEEVIGDDADHCNGRHGNAASELLRGNRRRMEMPVGVVDNLRAKAEHAQHEEEVFDHLHCHTRAWYPTHHQETP
jgi:hypothetical protein